MTKLALMRHAPTVWNAEGRIQGRSDIPLSPAGRTAASQWRLPAFLFTRRRLSSPLCRALETAALVGMADPEIEPRLAEMDWGQWEGSTLAELRRSDPDAMTANEAAGLDFRPAGGESPRDVRQRLGSLVKDLAADGRDTVAVTHRGVMRAALSLATGWDLFEASPVSIPRYGLLMLTLETANVPSLDEPAVLDLGGA